MKKNVFEYTFVLLGALSLFVAVWVFYQKIHSKPLSQAEQKETLIVRAVIKEYDCVQCIEKVLCYWKNIESDMAVQKISVQIVFAIEDRVKFNRKHLELLCPLPGRLEYNDYEAIRQWTTFPISTPAIIVTNNRQVLYMEPIFLNTEMTSVHQHLNEVLANALPQTRVITASQN